MIFLLVIILSLPYNQCIDNRFLHEVAEKPYSALVCEEGLSLEYELSLFDRVDEKISNIGNKIAAIRVKRPIDKAKKLKPKIENVNRVVQVDNEDDDLPDLVLNGPEHTPVRLQIDDMSLPAEDSYASAGFSVPDPVADEIEEVEFEELSEESTWYSEAYHSNDRLLNVMLAQTIHPGRLQFNIFHRTTVPFTTSPLRDFLGLDNGLKVGIGFRYGIFEGLDAGFLRVNGVFEPFDVYEFDVRVRAVEYKGFATGVRVGVTTFYEPEFLSSAWFMQIGMEKRFFDRLLFAINTSYHSDSSYFNKTEDDVDASCNVGGGMEVRINDWFALNGDILYTLVGFRRKFPVFAAGPKFHSHRHTFAIVMANSPQMSFDGLLANTQYGEFNEFLLGFNITREFDIME